MSDNIKKEFITPKKVGRPTIGLLTDDLNLGYQQAIWLGAVENAKEQDINLVTLVGGALNDPDGYNSQANAIYDLIAKENLDGLIIMSGAIFSTAPPDEVQAFLEQFKSLPIVSIAMTFEGIPSLLVDNYSGIYTMVSHLIDEHHYRNIAFIQQYEGNPEFDERYRGYTDALSAHDIPLDPMLVVPPQYDNAPGEGLAFLLDERKVTVDVIVTGDDNMAIPLQEHIQARGLHVPDDIAIVGFDDIEDSRYISPPLTTIRQPLYEQGQQAVDLILAKMHDEQVPETVNLATELIVRQSCGCLLTEIVEVMHYEANANTTGDLNFAAQRETIIEQILEVTGSSKALTSLVAELLDGYIVAIQEQHFETFLHIADRIFNKISQEGHDILRWQAALTVLRRYTLAILNNKEAFAQADNLLHQIRVMIAEMGQRNQARLRVQAAQQENIFRVWGRELTTAVEMDDVLRIIATGAPTLGFPCSALILYEDRDPAAEQLQLILAYDAHGRKILHPKGQTFSREQLIPKNIFDEDRSYSLVIEALSYRNENFGYAVFEIGPSDGSSYDELAEHISSALQNIFTIRQMESRAVQIQTASEVSRAASSILESGDLTQIIVDLIKERFNLYYAGIFLVDEDHQWANLQAGTGDSGKNMIEEDWRLDIGGGSMIGRCIETGEADIQLNIDKAPVHLRNPHLPETKSEMALPLFSRGEVLGALTIQSEKANAFSLEDTQVLQTMANQVATSIANARLFEQTQTALLDTETLLNISRLASSSVEIEASLEQVLNLTLKSTDIEAGLFSIVNPKTNQLEISAYQIPESFLNTLQANGLEGTLCDLVYQQRESIVVHNLAEDSPIDASGLIDLGFKSYQGVPLETKGDIFGTLCTFSNSILNPDDSRIILLQAIGQQVGVAIENSTLFEQTQIALAETAIQTERLAALNKLSGELATTETVDDIYKVSAPLISQIIPCERNSIANLLEDGKRVELFAVGGEEGYTPTGTILDLEGTLLGDAIKNCAVIAHPDPESKYATSTTLTSQDLESYIVVPLVIGGVAIGTLNFGWTTTEGLSFRDRDLAIQSGALISNAIENRNLLEQAQDQAQRLVALNELSRKLTEAKTLDDIYRVSAPLISQIIPCDRNSIANLLEDGQHVQLFAVSGDEGYTPTGTILNIEGMPFGDAIKTRSVVAFPDVTKTNYAASSNLASQDLESYLVVPLIISGEAIGSLNFGWNAADGLSKRARDLAIQTGSLISNAIANQNLIQQTQDTLTELETTQRRYQIQAWSTYNQARTSNGYQQTQEGLEPLGKQKISEVDQAIQEATPVVSEDGENLKLTIPIMLRDQPIGAIGIQAGEDKHQWSAEEIDLAQEIGEQFALAAESIRLLDETQRRAARERLVTEITTKIRASNDPQNMIQTAAQELREALQAKRSQVIIQPATTKPEHPERGDE